MHQLNVLFLVVVLLLLLLPPLIESREQEISLNEETPIGTIIFDLNTLSSSSITYQLLESSSLLAFNSSTNLITIAKRIDRDTLCPNDDTCSKCHLTMKFYDMFYYDILILKFNINDINDNPPIFSSHSYSISLTENNIPGIKIRLSKADDIDCMNNGVQLYELTYVLHGHVIISSINLLLQQQQQQQNQTINQPFYLLYDSNFDLYLVINQTLDREFQSEYIFTITANDYTHTISAKLTLTVLDVNDHIARFSQSIYSVNVSQSTLPGTVLLKLTAVDRDSEPNARIYYTLLTIDGINNRNDLFQINSQTGELRLLTNLTSFDSKRLFKLIIGASDGSHNAIPALATVYVNLIHQSIISITFGSNRISKNASEVFIAENLPNATFIAYINSEETLRVLSKSMDRGYFIQKLTDNSFTLLTDRSYDREIRSNYDVLIRSDTAERFFRIIVTDVNDCPPTWNTTLFNINVHSEQMILTLNATDADQGQNGRVSYRKTGPLWPKWIELRRHQLIINCANTSENPCWQDLSKGDVLLDVEAYDHGKPELFSMVKLRLYRGTTSRAMLVRYEYVITGIASVLGMFCVLSLIFVGICCRRRKSKMNKEIIDDNSTKQKIIQTSSSEQSSSADSLYGSEKSDNITLETATSCHLVSFVHSFFDQTNLCLLRFRICFSFLRNERRP